VKASTLIGILIGFAAIFGAFIWEGGSLDTLIMWPAMTIVFVGTLAAGTAGTSFQQLAKMPGLIKLSFSPPVYDKEKIIVQMSDFAYIARREGILSVENQFSKIEHPFLRKLFRICIDGADPATLHNIAETEISFITERHMKNINFFIKLGGYSPTMGIIGTVMGLIATLAAAGSDPNVLIHHIASAFIATMWGIFMANIVWLPIGDKLKSIHEEEMQLMQVFLDGVHSVLLGETPSVVRSKLISAFPLNEQEDLMKRFSAIDKKYFKKKPSTTQTQAESKPGVKEDVKINPAGRLNQ
jgi:chemotaxis protein MotA